MLFYLFKILEAFQCFSKTFSAYLFFIPIHSLFSYLYKAPPASFKSFIHSFSWGLWIELWEIQNKTKSKTLWVRNGLKNKGLKLTRSDTIRARTLARCDHRKISSTDHKAVIMDSSSQPFQPSSPSSPLSGFRRKSRFTHKNLSQLALSTSSCPLRIIAHIDLDAFYAQCEGIRLNLPVEQPLAVQVR